MWTLQPQTVWDSLRRQGVLFVELSHVEGPCLDDFPWAYEFMREQIAQRLPIYEGHYPWWAWLRPKPDLRCSYPHNCFLPGTPATRIELSVPAERVLLSNESAWWCVIQPTFLALGEEEQELPDFEDAAAQSVAWAERRKEALEWPLSAPWQYRVVPSWERIFDLEAITRGYGSGMVQATFERLELTDVVAVTEFKARPVP